MLQKRGKFIGVFDSGFGGVNILRGIVKELPSYNYLYLGDTARAPYGSRSKEVVYEFTKQAVDFLFTNNCEFIVLACNTASSDALRKIQQEYLPKHYPSKKVLGVLIPTAEEAIARTKNKKVGIVATEGTVLSNAFARELVKLDATTEVFQRACPLLVPIIEAGEHNSKAASMILESYLQPLTNQGIDTLILGCTHYGIFEEKIKKIIGPHICVVSGTNVVPKKLKNYLKKHPEIEKKIGKDRVIKFCSTDLTDKFVVLGSKFFGTNIKAEQVQLN